MICSGAGAATVTDAGCLAAESVFLPEGTEVALGVFVADGCFTLEVPPSWEASVIRASCEYTMARPVDCITCCSVPLLLVKKGEPCVFWKLPGFIVLTLS
ncbi:hypothetical protein D3C80_1746030 [compost metagenome]